MSKPLLLNESFYPNDIFGRLLFKLARWFALFGGSVLLLVVVISFVSIIGRFLFAKSLLGDFELVEIGCAVAISAFLPLCQIRDGHVVVDFVTSFLSAHTKQLMDGGISFVFGIVAAFFTWRMFYGVQDMYAYNEQSMLLHFPIWLAFIPVFLSFFLLSLCCFYIGVLKIKPATA